MWKRKLYYLGHFILADRKYLKYSRNFNGSLKFQCNNYQICQVTQHLAAWIAQIAKSNFVLPNPQRNRVQNFQKKVEGPLLAEKSFYMCTEQFEESCFKNHLKLGQIQSLKSVSWSRLSSKVGKIFEKYM